MDENVIADLKQFIAATMAQQTIVLRTEITHELHTGLARVEKKIDDLSAYVAEALDASNEANAKQLKDHERRITRLEHKAA